MDNKTIKVCLAGNPNTGKSSIFNLLTNLNQHTGNWSGKTVNNVVGRFKHQEYKVNIVDIPGTYSLYGVSKDELIARDELCFNKFDCVILVIDAITFEKNICLLFQILEFHKKVILVINLIDEARNKGIKIKKLLLMYKLGIPVVLTSCKTKEGIDELKNTIIEVTENRFPYNVISVKYPTVIETEIARLSKTFTSTYFSKRTLALRILDYNHLFYESIKKYGDENTKFDILNAKANNYHSDIVNTNYQIIKDLKTSCIHCVTDPLVKDKKIDKILTSKIFGIPIMIGILVLLFFLTISFANIPSSFLYNLLFSFEDNLFSFFNYFNINSNISNFLILGVYRTLAWVVAVMLPPMAIFFPLFTFLEDLGYLPRVSYNLDYYFNKAGCSGKQSLSMCMGLGCNASGVTSCRIIDSPKDKKIAILTNNFIPCNGRFPTFIAISLAFFSVFGNISATLMVVSMVISGVLMTFLVSYISSKLFFKNDQQFFTLELPAYRKPNLFRILHTSLIDRTFKLLIRAIKVAAPFGGMIYLLANTSINNQSILTIIANFLNPFAMIIGLDGVILLAFLLALPANEILLPIIIMTYSNLGVLTDYSSISGLKQLLIDNNWTMITALNIMLFSLLHFPCATTLLTIKKETNSRLFTFLCFLIPSLIAIVVCFITNLIFNL